MIVALKFKDAASLRSLLPWYLILSHALAWACSWVFLWWWWPISSFSV
jgi:hypothetical protein